MSLSDDMLKLNVLIGKIISNSEKHMVKNYAKTLEKLRTDIRKLYDKYEKSDGKLSLSEMSKYNRMKAFEKDIYDNLSKLYKDNSVLLKSTLENVFVITADKTIDSIESNKPKSITSLIRIKNELDIDKTVNEKMAGLHWSERMGHHRNNVIYNVNSTLKSGLAQGSTYKQMSDRLKDSLNNDVLKPIRIVRTESARVYSNTKIQSLDKCAKAGINMVKKWNSVKDERVRNQHSKMDGIVVDYDKDFTFPDGTKTKAPCMSKVPRHDIHCRCFITIDLKEHYNDEVVQNSNNDKIKSFNNTSKNGYNTDKIELQFFSNKDILKQTDKQLIKGINSYNKQISIHKNKIENPEMIYKNWNNFTEDRKKREIKHWSDEIDTFNKNIRDNKKELEKRGVKYEKN